MFRLIFTTGALVLGLAAAEVQAADGRVLDRIEDRIDRRESIIDRQTDRGPLDRIEDRLDRRESIADRRGFDRPGPVDRWERRKIRYWWQTRD